MSYILFFVFLIVLAAACVASREKARKCFSGLARRLRALRPSPTKGQSGRRVSSWAIKDENHRLRAPSIFWGGSFFNYCFSLTNTLLLLTLWEAAAPVGTRRILRAGGGGWEGIQGLEAFPSGNAL